MYKYTPPIRNTNIKRPVLSPIQKPFDMGSGINEIVILVRELNALKNDIYRNQKIAAEKLDQKLAEAQLAIEHAKTIQKGEPGVDAEIDYNYVISEVRSRIKTPEDGKTPVIDYTKIIDAVIAKLPPQKTQKEVTVNYKYIIAELKSQMAPTKETDPMAIIDTIMNLPEGKRLPLRLIDGLEQTISALRNQLSKGYLHGAGLSTVSHDTTLAGDGTPANPLTVLGGGNFVDNEIVAGLATTFTLANTPVAGSVHVFAKGQRLTLGAGNDYTITSTVITTANTWSAGDIVADYRK